MKTVVSIKPDLGASDEIVDMYVDENQLYIVVQKRDTKLSGDGKYHSAMGYIIEDVLKLIRMKQLSFSPMILQDAPEESLLEP